MNKLNLLFYSAAITTAIAGIIHLVLGIPSNSINSQILFVVYSLLVLEKKSFSKKEEKKG